MTGDGWIFKIIDSSKGPKRQKAQKRFLVKNIEDLIKLNNRTVIAEFNLWRLNILN